LIEHDPTTFATAAIVSTSDLLPRVPLDLRWEFRGMRGHRFQFVQLVGLGKRDCGHAVRLLSLRRREGAGPGDRSPILVERDAIKEASKLPSGSVLCIASRVAENVLVGWPTLAKATSLSVTASVRLEAKTQHPFAARRLDPSHDRIGNRRTLTVNEHLWCNKRSLLFPKPRDSLLGLLNEQPAVYWIASSIAAVSVVDEKTIRLSDSTFVARCERSSELSEDRP